MERFPICLNMDRPVPIRSKDYRAASQIPGEHFLVREARAAAMTDREYRQLWFYRSDKGLRDAAIPDSRREPRLRSRSGTLLSQSGALPGCLLLLGWKPVTPAGWSTLMIRCFFEGLLHVITA